MSELTPTDRDVRVGDAERRAVDERLHAAVGSGQLTLAEYDERCQAVWAARTRGDLDAVVRDLPSAPAGPVSPTAPGSAPRRAVAVMSEERLQGPWVQGQTVEGVAVMGAARLDLRRGDLPPEVFLRAYAVMGEVEVLVPDGATVHLTGASVMGQRSVHVGDPVLGGPVVHLRAWAVMGSVNVRAVTAPAAVLAPGAVPVQPGPGPVHHRWHATPAGAVAAVDRASRRRRLRRLGLVSLAVCGVVTLAAGGDDDGGSRGGGVGDRTVFVQPGQARVVVEGGVGDVTVVVPDGVRAVLGEASRVGEVECDEACTTESTTTVVVDVLGGVGDVDVQTAEEYSD